jgi:hypothetical protein
MSLPFIPMFAVAALLLTCAPPDAFAVEADTRPSAIEIAQLPQFCWHHYNVPNAVGPEFDMPPPKLCGYGMNHYCNGLVALIRAKHAVGRGERLSMLGAARQNILYTEGAIQAYPECPIHDHVAASKAEVDHLLAISGGKRP